MMEPSRSTDFPSWGSASAAAGRGGGGSDGSGSGGGASQPPGGSQIPPSSQAPASSHPSPSPSSLSLPPAKRRGSAGESGSAGAGGSGGGSGGGGGAGGAGDGHPSGYGVGADGGGGDRGAPSGGGVAGSGVMGPSGSYDGGGGVGGGGSWRMSKPPPVLRGGPIPAGADGGGNGRATGLHPGLGTPGLSVVPGACGSGSVGGGGGGGGAPHGRGQMQPPHPPSLPPPPVAPQQALYSYDDQGDGASLRMPGSGIPPSSGSASGALASVPLAQQLAASMSFVGPYHGEGIAGIHGQTGPLGPGRLPMGGGGGNGPMAGGGAYPPIMMAPGPAGNVNVGGDQTQEGLRYPGQVQAEEMPPVGFGYHYGGQQMPHAFLVNHGGGAGGGGGEAPLEAQPAPVLVGTCSPATLRAPVHSAMAA